MSKRMYKSGDLIISIQELVEQERIFCRNKLEHKGWFMSWQLRYAMQAIERRELRKAVKIETEIGEFYEKESEDRTAC